MSTTQPKPSEAMTPQSGLPPLDEQVVVITGASSGIGRETALLLARRGASVVAAARNEEALTSLVAEIERSGGRAEAVVTDVVSLNASARTDAAWPAPCVPLVARTVIR